MSTQTITFQLATQLLSRVALRLEFLFKTINEACHESHEIIHRFALKNIIEIIELVEKPELKSRFLKELIRIEHVLKKQSPIDNAELSDALSAHIHLLNHLPGRFGSLIHENEFLKILRQIHHPNTQDCEFNSPHLVMWFDSDPVLRQKAITQWVKCLQDLEDTVTVYLALLRDASVYNPISISNGFYQHNISPQTNNHLILLRLKKSLGIIPKLQLGRHNLTIWLYESGSTYEIRDRIIGMDIAFCQI